MLNRPRQTYVKLPRSCHYTTDVSVPRKDHCVSVKSAEPALNRSKSDFPWRTRGEPSITGSFARGQAVLPSGLSLTVNASCVILPFAMCRDIDCWCFDMLLLNLHILLGGSTLGDNYPTPKTSALLPGCDIKHYLTNSKYRYICVC